MVGGTKMDVLNELQLVSNVGEATIIAIIAIGFTNLIKKTPLPNWTMPLVAMVVGAITGVIIGLIFEEDNLATAGLYGFLVGGFASGVFQFVKGGLNNAQSVKEQSNIITPTKQENDLEDKLEANTDKLESKTVLKDEPQQYKGEN